MHIRLVEFMTRKEADNLQTDDSVASVMLSSTPVVQGDFLPLFSLLFWTRDKSCRCERGAREGGEWREVGQASGPVPTAVCVCAFRVPSYRPFLPRPEPSRHHSRPARPAAAFRSRAKEIEPLT